MRDRFGCISKYVKPISLKRSLDTRTFKCKQSKRNGMPSLLSNVYRRNSFSHIHSLPFFYAVDVSPPPYCSFSSHSPTCIHSYLPPRHTFFFFPLWPLNYFSHYLCKVLSVHFLHLLSVDNRDKDHVIFCYFISLPTICII